MIRPKNSDEVSHPFARMKAKGLGTQHLQPGSISEPNLIRASGPIAAAKWHTISMLNFNDERQLPTVLLIDDDFVSREVTATVLTMSGYTVHTAVDGATSLELLAGESFVPELILMDAQMPGLSGTPLIEQLRARTRAAIITVSGSSAPDDVCAAADGFLLKPFGAEDLRKLLEEREAQAEPAAATVAEPLRESGEPIVSAETLAQLREMMPEAAVRQINAAVVADLGRRLDALEAAIAKGDAAKARRIGHAIKGGCGMAGALQAAHLGASIEDGALDIEIASRGNQPDNSFAILQDLHAAAHNLQRMLEAEFPV